MCPSDISRNVYPKAYVTKIVNQVEWVAKRASLSDWAFLHQDFRITLSCATKADFIYCDPPLYRATYRLF